MPIVNLKTDYEGTIRFNSSAAEVTLPPDKKFDKYAQYSFPAASFSITTPGLQTITVRDRDASPVVSTTSAPIDVSALRITAMTTAPVRISQGQSGLLVQMELENIGSSEVTDLSTGLHFGPGRDGDYTYTYSWPAGLPIIPANSRRTVKIFIVAAQTTAQTGSIRISGFGKRDLQRAAGQRWMTLQIRHLGWSSKNRYSPDQRHHRGGYGEPGPERHPDRVRRQEWLFFTALADARISAAPFTFRLNDTNNVSASFPVTAALTNDTLIAATQSRTLRFLSAVNPYGSGPQDSHLTPLFATGR